MTKCHVVDILSVALLLFLFFQPIQVLGTFQVQVQVPGHEYNNFSRDHNHSGHASHASLNVSVHGGGSAGAGAAGNNASDTVQMIVTEFMKWVNFVAGLHHSPFPVASNKYVPDKTITVDPRASAGGFTSIQAAIDSIPMVNQLRTLIKVNPGVYKEKLIISPLRAYITIQGSGAGDTVVEWGGDGAQHQGAFDSATVSVNAPYFIAKNITFKNTNSRAEGGHGVALRVSGDTASFTGCKFLGTSNTLYDHIGRHYYKDCWIQGAAEFIFGQALSLFEGCNLSAIADAAGKYTAHTTGVSLLNNAGMSFSNCKLTGAALAYLCRAWGTFAKVIISNSHLDHVQLPGGFEKMLGPKTQMHVLFGLHNCSGPGANFVKKISWAKELTLPQVEPFSSLNYIDGNEWINPGDVFVRIDDAHPSNIVARKEEWIINSSL